MRQAPLRLLGGPAVPARPYIQWTRTVKGKTVTRLLTPAQYQAYAPWFGNARRLRTLTAELQALSLQEMARGEGWATITPRTHAIADTGSAAHRARSVSSMAISRSSMTARPCSASKAASPGSHGLCAGDPVNGVDSPVSSACR